MEWYQYLASFFAGVFFANAVPHFLQGISGNKFPTPFSNPRGVGLSSPPTNVIWALFNLLIGYLLFTVGKPDSVHLLSRLVFFGGLAVMSITLSIRFKRKHKE
jgi:hypothetical protein